MVITRGNLAPKSCPMSAEGRRPPEGPPRGADGESMADGRTLVRSLFGSVGILIVVGVIATLSLGPDVLAGLHSKWAADAGHTLAYGVLTATALAAHASRGVRRGRTFRVILVVGCAIALGALMEAGQAVVGRDAEWADVVANSSGVLGGFGAWVVAGSGRGALSRSSRRSGVPTSP